MNFGKISAFYLAVAACLVMPGTAFAVTDTVTFSGTPPNLGKLVRGNSDSVFTIAADTGAVTSSLGNGAARVGNLSTTTTQTVSVKCASNCKGVTVSVVVTANNAGPINITEFNVGTLSGNVSGSWQTPLPAAGTSMTFQFTFDNAGNNAASKTATFKLGMKVKAAANGNSTGTLTFPYSVTASH
jgi:hypothetical protein